MPRVNLGKPPADEIMGLFLERKRALKLTKHVATTALIVSALIPPPILRAVVAALA